MKYFDTLEIEDKKDLLRHSGEFAARKSNSTLWVLHEMYVEISFTRMGAI